VLLVLVCALLTASLLASPPALADGDPASDVLASEPLFVPIDGGFPPAQVTRLGALLTEAQRAGYPIRVALIAAPADLGSVTELWRMPRSYARFLGQELSLVYRGLLLVVMPDGLGVDDVGGAAGGRSGAASVPPPRPRESMLSSTIAAVRSLAAASGHPLALPRTTAGRGAGAGLGSIDPGSWLALVAGVALIALAWTASLRARPPARLRRAR
jgi:hypothetical protein